MSDTASAIPSFAKLLLMLADEKASEPIALHEFVSLPSVKAGLLLDFGHQSSTEHERLFIRLAIALGRTSLPVWTEAYPDLFGPVDAITQAEKWTACPCDQCADLASARQPQANRESLSVWRKEPKRAAWAGRTAAWVADAPKFGWQAVCAVMGAQKALGPEKALRATALFLETEKQGAQEGVEPSVTQTLAE